MSSFVIDASVGVKWIIAEPLQTEALRYLHPNYTLFVPNLFLLECASAIQKKVWRNENQAGRGWNAYETLRDYGRLIYTPFSDLLPRAYELANQYSHPIYDCIYLALALHKNTSVVTADRKFYDQMQETSLENLMIWVQEIPENST